MNRLVPLAETATVYYEFSRLRSLSHWWQWLLLVLVCALVGCFVTWYYRRDTVEHAAAKRWSLIALRLAAFAAILFFFLDLEKRSQREVVKHSRVAVLVDTSLSMGIRDEGGDRTTGRRRVDAVVEAFRQSPLLQRLRQQHDVVVYRFDQTALPVEVGSFARPPRQVAEDAGQTADAWYAALRGARWTAATGAVLAAAGLLAWMASGLLAWIRGAPEGSWLQPAGMVALLAGVVVLGTAQLRYPQVDFAATLGFRAAEPPAAVTSSRENDPDDRQGDQPGRIPSVDWEAELAPRGTETRLGDALRAMVNKERGGSIAGIVIVSDGGSNAGIDYQQSVAAAKAAQIPVYTIGLGSSERQANVRVVDVVAPPRVYPGDHFSLTGYLQAFAFEGRTVQVRLTSSPDSDPQGAAVQETLEETREVKLLANGQIAQVQFEVMPAAAGRRRYHLQVDAPPEDHDPRDNQRTTKVEIVQRKNRVLLMAGGPTREFRFLRDLLFRDHDTEVHVLLQTAVPGIAQDADATLFEFPDTPDVLFEYDCVVAFDPDWQALDELQVELLERWVSEEAGGLIVVAGAVHTPLWAGRAPADPRLDTIKALYPVVFYSRAAATLRLGRISSESAWPLEFTRDGREAEFLWLEDDAVLSRSAWDSFSGVYGYFAVKDPKPGARVYARFSDPGTAIDGDLPIYMAGHFYGAGRVFFQASGEMWRVRALNDAFFERYYTKLIRWVSQGRLLRDSSRGVLLVDKTRCLLGDHIGVRAILQDAQHDPLTVESVTATLVDPDGQRAPLVMRRVRNAARDGMYAAQFTATEEGDYRVELQPPHAGPRELLVREVLARIPALETERPERNDALLKSVAQQTGGRYYVGMASAAGASGAARVPLAEQIEPQDQVTYVSGTPDRDYDRLLMTWLMGILCGALCLEWLIRRLSKLA